MKKVSQEWDEVKYKLNREEKRLVTKAAIQRSEAITFANLQTKNIAMFKAGIAYCLKFISPKP